MIVVGGSASTGSSLLARCLDRHSKLSCGPETNLLARPQLIHHWDRYKKSLYGKQILKLRNTGWHRYYGLTHHDPYYPWSRLSLSSCASQVSGFKGFIKRIERDILSYYKTVEWIEKTPANVYTMALLLDKQMIQHAVLVVRDPYDAIASMVMRGHTEIYAVALYLLNTAVGLGACTQIVRYEDLVGDPALTLTKLITPWTYHYEEVMLIPEHQQISMEGWLNDESGDVSMESIGRYDHLPPTRKALINHCIHTFRINSAAYPDLDCRSIAALAQRLDYQLKKPSVDSPSSGAIRRSLLTERWRRWSGGYSGHFINFPIEYHPY